VPADDTRHVKASPSVNAAGLIVAALALVALASGRAPRPSALAVRATSHAVGPALQPASSALAALREGEPLDLNRARVEDLRLLPGIGPKLAQRIVDERARRGSYQSIDDLLEVKGIGRATLARMSRFVRVDTGLRDRTKVRASRSR
jgi:competence ComEA-like helix-hairpin-helix protein